MSNAKVQVPTEHGIAEYNVTAADATNQVDAIRDAIVRAALLHELEQSPDIRDSMLDIVRAAI